MTILFTFFSIFILGYITGYLNGKHIDSGLTIREAIEKSKNAVMERDTLRPGIIRRPSAQELYKRNEPQIVREEKDAIKESLDNIPELQEHKKLFKKYNS